MLLREQHAPTKCVKPNLAALQHVQRLARNLLILGPRGIRVRRVAEQAPVRRHVCNAKKRREKIRKTQKTKKKTDTGASECQTHIYKGMKGQMGKVLR